jgi:AcrR family transcriptional regulator
MKLHHDGGLLARHAEALSSEEQILLAALACFVEKGFHGTTVRSIAARGGLSVPGLYHHFPSKTALLERLIDDTMDDLITTTESALAAAGPGVVERFDAVVTAHVRFHCERSEESFIGNSELRSLAPTARKRTIRKRDRQQHIFDTVIAEGVAAGVFDIEPHHDASRAMVTMCTAVATWYRRSGPRSAQEIVEIYRQLARNIVGYKATSSAQVSPTSAAGGKRAQSDPPARVAARAGTRRR